MELSATNNLESARKGTSIYEAVRANEWWEHKLAPTFTTVYATAYTLQISLVSLWPMLLLALAALVSCAAYVSVLNDVADIDDDLASGKRNRVAGMSRAFVGTILTCAILSGLAVTIYLRHDRLLLSLYVSAWIAFTIYSLPPLRLKGRGVLGLLADACGAHVFPTLFVVCLVYRWSGKPIDVMWFVAVAVWSLSLGVRGILWHQITDLENDAKIQLRTFARTHKLSRLQGLGNFIIFPAELCAFAVMMWRVQSSIPFAMLCLYAVLELGRAKFWRVNLIVVAPKPKFKILMLEYYEFFFPLAVLLLLSWRYHADAFIAVAHFLVFPQRATRTVMDVLEFLKKPWRMLTT